MTKNTTSAMIFCIISILLVLGYSLTERENNNSIKGAQVINLNKQNENIRETVKQKDIEDQSINNDHDQPIKIYRSEELGISFQYPYTFVKVYEDNYKGIKLVSVKFSDDNDNLANFSLASADYEKLRTCDDILENGFDGGDRTVSVCKTLIVDNQNVAFITFGESRFGGSYSKVVDFQTKQGVWRFYLGSINVEDNINIVKTMKYIK